MHFQWYPGHMTKAKRMMQENIKLVDLVIELVDARIPLSSRNPDIDGLGKNKARVVLLNKADLAEEKWNVSWSRYFEDKGYLAVKVNSKKGSGRSGCYRKGLQRKDRTGQKARHLKPSGARYGGRDPECGQIHIYQCPGRQGMCKDRQQAGGD